jgi:hypothetical protein
MLLLGKPKGDDIISGFSENDEWMEKRPSGCWHVCENQMKKFKRAAFVLLLSILGGQVLQRKPEERLLYDGSLRALGGVFC